MSRVSSLLLFVCLACFAFAHTTGQQPRQQATTSSPLQVIYVVGTTSIDTYNIDSQTLSATQVGTLPINNPSYYYWLVPSANDHFIYFANIDSQSNWHLYVYKTDVLGAPQAPATQEISSANAFILQLDPKANFAYAVFWRPSDAYNDVYSLRRYVVDPNTGRLSQPQLQAKYVLPNGAGGSEGCSFGITGFNPAATTMYDEIDCWFHGGDSATFYERSLDPQTGSLGQDVEVTAWANTWGGTDRIQFIGNHLFSFNNPDDWQQGINTVGIYPVVPNTSKPLLLCDAQMLQACGYGGGVADPSGKYIFEEIVQGLTHIDRVELSNKRIVDTGNYVPDSAYQFSPDGTLVFGIAWTSSGYYVDIYGFDVGTSAVRIGGSIFVPGLASYFSAERD